MELDRPILRSIETIVESEVGASFEVKTFLKRIGRYPNATIILDSSVFIRYEKNSRFMREELFRLESKGRKIVVPYAVLRELKGAEIPVAWHQTVDCQEIHKHRAEAIEHLKKSRKMQVYNLLMPIVKKFMEGKPYEVTTAQLQLLEDKKHLLEQVLRSDFSVLLQENGATKAYALLTESFKISEADTAVVAVAISACRRTGNPVIIGARDWDIQDAVHDLRRDYPLLHYVKATGPKPSGSRTGTQK
ncbi:MAG: hypothetical protein Q7K43_01825 [Candidatus Woesearchaeota archaeon]|nr:hypothetical protein [Candidatus Woesearchaeota archaeon]